MGKLNVKRIEKIFRPDPSRVIIKSHIPSGEGRIENIITRVLNLSDEEANKILQGIIEDFSRRHKNIWNALDKHYNRIKKYIPSTLPEDKLYLRAADYPGNIIPLPAACRYSLY